MRVSHYRVLVCSIYTTALLSLLATLRTLSRDLPAGPAATAHNNADGEKS